MRRQMKKRVSWRYKEKLNEEETGNLVGKKNQSNVRKDDPWSQKKNVGINWDGKRHVRQRPKRSKEQAQINDTITRIKKKKIH